MRKELLFIALVLAFLAVDLALATTGGTVNAAAATWWDEIKLALQGNVGRILSVAAAGTGLYLFYRGAWQFGIVALLVAYGIYRLPQTVETTYTLTF